MLETLIQQSPLSGTELEIAYRHEMTLDLGSEDSNYWLVTRKSDGARLWLKAARDSGRRKQLADEFRLLSHLKCQGIAEVVENGTDSEVPHIAFRYKGEQPFNKADMAEYQPLELLSFGLSVAKLLHCLEGNKPPAALLEIDSAPLLVSPMLKRPLLLGLGRYAQTASEESHRTARESAWQLIGDALAAEPQLADAQGLQLLGKQWVTDGQDVFNSLHQAFNAAAFNHAARDL